MFLICNNSMHWLEIFKFQRLLIQMLNQWEYFLKTKLPAGSQPNWPMRKTLIHLRKQQGKSQINVSNRDIESCKNDANEYERIILIEHIHTYTNCSQHFLKEQTYADKKLKSGIMLINFGFISHIFSSKRSMLNKHHWSTNKRFSNAVFLGAFLFRLEPGTERIVLRYILISRVSQSVRSV